MTQQKQQKNILIGAFSVLIIVFVGLLIWRTSFFRSVSPSAPPPVVSQRTTFDLGDKVQFLSIAWPVPGAKLTSPLVVAGRARLWYFEGSFPVLLKDAKGDVLATGQATAEGDWMSEKFVPFKAALVFSKPTTATGELILKKDNPSGLPANDDQVSLAVQFDLSDPSWLAAPTSPPAAACRIGGCSGQLCTDQADAITDCLYLPEYACYKSATCVRQADGKCGWLQTPVLKSCIANARKK